MMSSVSLALMAALMLVSSVSAQFDPNKPNVFSDTELQRLGDDLYSHSPSHATGKSKAWDAGWIPQWCYDEARSFGLNPADFEVRNVQFDDCGASWALCRHNSVQKTWAMIEDRLGRVPVGMRQYVANAAIVPDNLKGGFCAHASSQQLSTTLSTGCFELGVLVHEITHILDGNALKSVAPNGAYSTTDHWMGAYNKDTHVPTAYSRNTIFEDFADVGRVSLSEWMNPGVLARTNANVNKVANQLGNFSARLKSVILPAGHRCTSKVDTTKAVPVGARSAKMSANFAPARLGSLEGSDVPEIPKPEGADTESRIVYNGPRPHGA